MSTGTAPKHLLNGEIEPSGRRRTSRTVLTFVWAFVAVGLSIGAWAVSTPLGGGPDEGGQVSQAVAVVRGQLDGHQLVVKVGPVTIGRVGIVEVPRWVADSGGVAACFAWHPSVPASCARSLGNDTTPVQATTPFSNFPPLYYLMVGVPSLVATGSGALYGMRIAAALLDSLLIAVGLFLLARYHPRRMSLVGAMVALSPMVLYIAAVINSSGMEVAAAFAAWCGGLCVVERTVIPRAPALLTALSFGILILSRPTSPVNAAVIIVVLATLIGWTRARALLLERSLRPLWMAVLGAIVVAGFALLIGGLPPLLGFPQKPPLSLLGSVWLTLRLTGDRLGQCIGSFGWLDTPAPRLVDIIWTATVVGLCAYGLAVSRRCRRALPLLVFAMLAVSVIFESPRINAVGLYWQGRYWLPLAVGLPLVASSIKPRMVHQRSRFAVPSSLKIVGVAGVLLLLAVAQIATFLTSLHRYEIGLGAKEGSPIKWAPPGGTVLVETLFVVGQALLVGFLIWKYRETRRPSETRATDGAHSTTHQETSCAPANLPMT